MVIFVHDGSFEGLLTAIYEAYYRGERPDAIVSRNCLQTGFLDSYLFIETEQEKAARVYDSVKRKISANALDNAYLVHLSGLEDSGTIVYRYLRLGWKMGPGVDSHLSDDRVMNAHKISSRVDREMNRMKGFVRFSLLEGGIYYAPIKPAYNITGLLAPHFAERLAGQNWAIHDTARDIAAVCCGGKWVLLDNLAEHLPGFAKEEAEYRLLWKEFFDSIAISSRTNLRLQKALIPRRYRRNLTEFTTLR